MRVYLAGPDVFLPDPQARAATLKAICTRHGLVGVSPLDPLDNEPPEWAILSEAFRIARRNEAHIASCDALIANLTPFRGPSADAGTVFELGYMRALGRKVHGWTNDSRAFADRTRAFCGTTGTIDGEGMLVEDFDLADNLMIESAIAASGGVFVQYNCHPGQAWTDLSGFERCVSQASGLQDT